VAFWSLVGDQPRPAFQAVSDDRVALKAVLPLQPSMTIADMRGGIRTTVVESGLSLDGTTGCRAGTNLAPPLSIEDPMLVQVRFSDTDLPSAARKEN
jgi:hypothetical protein